MSQTSVRDNEEAQYMVTVAETVVMEGRGEFMVKGAVAGSLSESGEFLFSACKENLAKRGITAANSLHEIGSANNHLLIRVINPAPTDKRLYRGTVLGYLEKLVSTDDSQVVFNLDNSTQCTPEEVVEQIISEHREILNQSEIESLTEMLYKFRGVFSRSSTDVGCARDYHHNVDTGQCPPVAAAPRRVERHVENEVENLVGNLKKKGIITPCHSPWNSPIVVVRKKSGELRLCIDYRRLNAITNRPIYPIPDSRDLFDCLGGSNYFSTLDLSMGYYQIPMNQEDAEKTAFTTRTGQYNFARMPFGLSGAPATFQRVMADVLREFNWKACVIYIDDVLIFGRSLQEHNDRLAAVLKRFIEAGLKLSPSKCTFMRRQVKYLGHIMDSRGVHTDPDKVSCIKNWPRPASNKDLHTFLGLCGYYRRFVRDYASLSKPLDTLLQKTKGKGAQFEWNETHEASFQLLKGKLTQAPILAFPDHEGLFILDCDASSDAIGAVLSQVQGGIEKVVSYASNQLTKAERLYCTTRRELLAVYKYVKMFRHYLLGRDFKIRTDHKALTWMLKWDNPNTSQYSAWKAELEEYQFVIEHRAGEKHQNADSLSRMPPPCGQCSLPHPDPRPTRNVKVIATACNNEEPHQDHQETEAMPSSNRDPVQIVISKLLRGTSEDTRLSRDELNPETVFLWRRRNSLSVKNGKLCFQQHKGPTLEIPLLRDRGQLLRDLHRRLAHAGSKKCLNVLKGVYYWPGMDLDLRLEVRKCSLCARYKRSYEQHRGAGTVASTYPFHTISIDIADMGSITRSGHRYIMGVIDNFSRYPMLIPLKDLSSASVATALFKHWIAVFGIPERILSDNGRSFRSDVVQRLCTLLGISKIFSSPYYPQGDGLVERLFGTVKPMIRIMVNERSCEWTDVIPFVELSLRSTIQGATGFTASEVVFGKTIQNAFDADYSHVTEGFDETPLFIRSMMQLTRATHDTIRRSQQCQDAPQPMFKVGDLAWARIPHPTDGARYEGPYRVVRKVGDYTYDLQHHQSGDIIRRNRRHIKRGGEEDNDRHTSITSHRSRQPPSTPPAHDPPRPRRYPVRQRRGVQRYGFSGV